MALELVVLLGVTMSFAEFNVPVSAVAKSVISIVQRPLVFWPAKALRACSARNVPVNEPLTLTVELVAESLKVSRMLSDEPPRRFTKFTAVPVGEINRTRRSLT